jgi:hypothetical protein
MVEYMRQEPPVRPEAAICEQCEDSGRWRDAMHECTDAALMDCPVADSRIKVEKCEAVENARYNARYRATKGYQGRQRCQAVEYSGYNLDNRVQRTGAA